MDKDATIKKQAGIDKLNKYVNYYEIQTLCKLLNKSDEEVMNMDDVFATMFLLSNKESINFENSYHEIKSKQ